MHPVSASFNNFIQQIQNLGQVAPGQKVVVASGKLRVRSWYDNLGDWLAKLFHKPISNPNSSIRKKLGSLKNQIKVLDLNTLATTEIPQMQKKIGSYLRTIRLAEIGLSNLSATYAQEKKEVTKGVVNSLKEDLLSLQKALLYKYPQGVLSNEWQTYGYEIQHICLMNKENRTDVEKQFLKDIRHVMYREIAEAYKTKWKHATGTSFANGTLTCTTNQFKAARAQIQHQYPQLFYLAFDNALRLEMAKLTAYVLSEKSLKITTPYCFKMGDTPQLLTKTEYNTTSKSNLLYLMDSSFTTPETQIHDALSLFYWDILKRKNYDYALVKTKRSTTELDENKEYYFLSDVKNRYQAHLSHHPSIVKGLVTQLKKSDFFQALKSRGWITASAKFKLKTLLKNIPHQKEVEYPLRKAIKKFELSNKQLTDLAQKTGCTKADIATLFRIKFLELTIMLTQSFQEDHAKSMQDRFSHYTREDSPISVAFMPGSTYFFSTNLKGYQYQKSEKINFSDPYLENPFQFERVFQGGELDSVIEVPSFLGRQINLSKQEVRLSWDCPLSFVEELKHPS